MARYSGIIGYRVEEEVAPGIWEEVIIERTYYGDSNRLSRNLQEGTSIIDKPKISSELSIVADPFANQNWDCIIYACYLGKKFKVENVQVQFPRLILTLGDLYIEQEEENENDDKTRTA